MEILTLKIKITESIQLEHGEKKEQSFENK